MSSGGEVALTESSRIYRRALGALVLAAGLGPPAPRLDRKRAGVSRGIFFLDLLFLAELFLVLFSF